MIEVDDSAEAPKASDTLKIDFYSRDYLLAKPISWKCPIFQQQRWRTSSRSPSRTASISRLARSY
jgi:hypothetical protein